MYCREHVEGEGACTMPSLRSNTSTASFAPYLLDLYRRFQTGSTTSLTLTRLSSRHVFQYLFLPSSLCPRDTVLVLNKHSLFGGCLQASTDCSGPFSRTRRRESRGPCRNLNGSFDGSTMRSAGASVRWRTSTSPKKRHSGPCSTAIRNSSDSE